MLVADSHSFSLLMEISLWPFALFTFSALIHFPISLAVIPGEERVSFGVSSNVVNAQSLVLGINKCNYPKWPCRIYAEWRQPINLFCFLYSPLPTATTFCQLFFEILWSKKYLCYQLPDPPWKGSSLLTLISSIIVYKMILHKDYCTRKWERNHSFS